MNNSIPGVQYAGCSPAEGSGGAWKEVTVRRKVWLMILLRNQFSREGRVRGIPVSRTLFLIDALAWMAAIVLAALLRYDFQPEAVSWRVIAGFMVGAAVLQLILGALFQLYRPGIKLRTGGFENTLTVAVVAGVVGAILWVVSLVGGPRWELSRALVLMSIPLALVLMLAFRYLARALVQRSRRPGPGATPALVFGGGYIGTHLIQWMMLDPASPYLPVGILDDDPRLARQRVRGVRVLGMLEDIEAAVEKTGAEALIVAIGRADSALLRRVHNAAATVGVAVKVMPAIGNVVEQGVRGGDLRDLAIEDLLGRQPVETNITEIAQYLTGKRVLVTGAGGSIGSQLCSEINKFAPEELIMLDRDESGLQQALINVEGNGLLDTNAVVLADIRDPEVLQDILLERQPDVVFHAAALKHLPMLEQYPEEAWKTNVLGTRNVLQAAAAANVDTFINISTDKAANPTSVLGHSKRVAEKLTSWFGEHTQRTYLSVRFGNVIGSRGSMLPTFMRLIEEDKPLTVTHPDVTRYFMTIPEACQLVLQAGGIGRSGEILVLDMGEPVSILEIAKRMIEMSGKEIDIVFTGLREGEKLHEELFGHDELENRPFHSKISHTRAKILAPEELSRDIFLREDPTLSPEEKRATEEKETV